MNKAKIKKIFYALRQVHPVNSVKVEECYGLKERGEGYDVFLTVFYDDNYNNFRVGFFSSEKGQRTYDTLTKMAIEQLKQIANEKAR